MFSKRYKSILTMHITMHDDSSISPCYYKFFANIFDGNIVFLCRSVE